MNMNRNKNVLKDVEASFLAQEALERERVTQKFVGNDEDWDDKGVFWD
jgi:hypothetical protein